MQISKKCIQFGLQMLHEKLLKQQTQFIHLPDLYYLAF